MTILGYTNLRYGAAGLFLLSAVGASAAGIERMAPSSRILFEDGRYLEFSASHAMPELTATSGNPTSNLFEDFTSFGAAYKADINDVLSYAVIFDTPWGVDTKYPDGAPYSGVAATLESYALTGIIAYDMTPAIKVYGGLRAQSLSAKAAIPFVGGYAVTTERDYGYGYMVGAAYSKPEIALRVALTYYSAIEHDLETRENLLAPAVTQTDVSTPQSINLEFQTGIMADTLLFGSIRWVDWSEFRIDPPGWPPPTPLVDYEKDWTTYTLGVGRKFNDTWSGALQVAYEPASNTTLTTLGPVDGRQSITGSLVYTRGNMKITGGVSYIELGKASNVVPTNFSGGSAWVAGIRIGLAL